MPKPMMCLFAPLCKYLELFRRCFSRRQWKYFVTVLLGLIEREGRHTLQGLRASVWEKVVCRGCRAFWGCGLGRQRRWRRPGKPISGRRWQRRCKPNIVASGPCDPSAEDVPRQPS